MHSAFQEDSLFDKISKLSSRFISYLLSFPLYYLLFAIPHNVSVRSVGDCWTYCVHDNSCYRVLCKWVHENIAPKKENINQSQRNVCWLSSCWCLCLKHREMSIFSISMWSLWGGGRKWREREDWPASFLDHGFEWLEVSVIIGIGLQNKTTKENKQDVHGIDNKSSLTERKF